MTKKEMIAESLRKIKQYCQTFSPKDRFAQMAASGIINQNGEVIVGDHNEQSKQGQRRI